MAKVKVYQADSRATGFGQGLLDKTEKIWDVAGFDGLISPGDQVAVKVHMGDSGTTRYLRPVFVRRVVDLIRTRTRGRPFVTDACTADYGYWVRRATPTEHLQTAAAHGFTPDSVNAPIVIADGMGASDDVEVDIPNGKHLKKTYVATGIVRADAMITLTHVKGHRFGVMGGAIKNLGIGCVSGRGKFHVHSCGRRWKAKIDLSKCKECDWIKYCSQCRMGAFRVEGGRPVHDEAKCGFDLWCWLICGLAGKGAVTIPNPDGRGYLANFQEAMTESAFAVARGFKPGKVGFVNYVVDVAPLCDCVSFTDVPFIMDQGIYASSSPKDNAQAMAAVDKASLEAVNKAAGLHGSAAEDRKCLESGSNKFEFIEGSDPWIQLRHADSLLREAVEYELEKVAITRADIEKLAKRYLEERRQWVLWG